MGTDKKDTAIMVGQRYYESVRFVGGPRDGETLSVPSLQNAPIKTGDTITVEHDHEYTVADTPPPVAAYAGQRPEPIAVTYE